MTNDIRDRLLQHPMRHRVLLAYRLEPASSSDIARRLGERVNLVSYHTNVLVRHGWLELVRTELRRGCTARVYRATTAGFIEDDAWEQIPLQQRRGLVRGLLALAADDARRAALAGGFDGPEAHVTRWPLTLDAEGAASMSEVLRGLVDDLARIQADSIARADDSADHVEVVLMGFAPAHDASP
jgi:hypothetical protein